MKKEDFITTFLQTKQLIEEEGRRTQREQTKQLIEGRKEKEKKTTTTKIKKDLKELYKPIYCYNIYDLKDSEILIAQFNNLNDLLEYINKYENSTITLSRLKHIIKESYIINDRYEIIKDKLHKINFIEDIEKGLQYEN